MKPVFFMAFLLISTQVFSGDLVKNLALHRVEGTDQARSIKGGFGGGYLLSKIGSLERGRWGTVSADPEIPTIIEDKARRAEPKRAMD